MLDRLSSNKENSPLPGATRGSKITPLGLGHASQSRSRIPRPIKTSNTSLAINRAKRSASGVKAQPTTKRPKNRSQPVPAVAAAPARATRQSPSPAPSSRTRNPFTGPLGDAILAAAVIKEEPADEEMTATSPPPTTTASGLMGPHIAYVNPAARISVRVPTTLARPDVPPTSSLKLNGELVPPQFALDKIQPALGNLLMVASHYHPYGSVPSPAEGHPTGLPHTFAFGVPLIVRGDDHDNSRAKAFGPFNPDLCLALRRAGTKEPFRLVPVHQVVYSSNCALLPSVDEVEMHTKFITGAESVKVEPTITEEILNDDNELDYPPNRSSVSELKNDTEVEDEFEDAKSFVSTASSSSAVSDVIHPDTGSYLHLPVLAIEIPDPDVFDYIHLRLYTPERKWQPSLLGLTAEQAPSPAAAFARLAALEPQLVERRMKLVFDVWRNMCALGIADDAMWSELNSAWGVLLATLSLHACAGSAGINWAA